MAFLFNRSAVIVTPKKKFADWVIKVDDSGLLTPTEKEIRKNQSVYLIDSSYSSEEKEIRSIMKFSYPEIAIQEFAGWWTVEDDWPILKNLKEFEAYFEWQYHDMVVDVAVEDLTLDEI